MKAIRIHGPEDARCEEVADPVVAPDDVLVRVRAVGICKTDIELYEGSMFYLTSGMASLPLIPGHEWSGEVVEVGREVTEFRVGDRVTGECSVGCRSCPACIRGWYSQCPHRTETGILNRPGAFAEYIAFPKYFLHKCSALDYDAASFIEPTGVAVYAAKRAEITPADHVAVMGPGPIGLFMLQAARAYGARKLILVGARGDDTRLAVGRELGADVLVNTDTDDVTEAVREATEGHMADVVLEAVGVPSVWEAIAGILAPRARVAMTGLFAGSKCAVDFDPIVVNNVTILGCLGGPSVWDEAISLHARGEITAKPLITHRLPLAEFARGVEIARKRQNEVIKVVVEP